MKKNQLQFCLSGNTAEIKTDKFTMPLSEDIRKVELCEKRYIVPDRLNSICVSEELFDYYGKEKVLILNAMNSKFLNVTLTKNTELFGSDILATPHVKSFLGVSSEDCLFLCRYKKINFNNFLTQKIEHIRENNLIISESDYNMLMNTFGYSGSNLFEVYNDFTHESIIVKKSHIFTDKTLEAGAIRLNRKQRIWLGLEAPQHLTEEQCSVLSEALINDPSGEIKEVLGLYCGDNHTLIDNASYNQKVLIKKVLSKYLKLGLQIIPVPETLGKPQKKSLARKTCDFFVGKSTLSLLARRPYDIDEGLDVVRMSGSNMKLLGIDEMDKVILRYKDKRISCRVLELENENAFFETNLPVSTDLVIGVPTHIRKKLGLFDLSSSVKVDRDTAFIFKKSINEQVVPILLTLFSANIFTDSSAIISALISLVAIPLVLYLNLSSKRNMRA